MQLKISSANRNGIDRSRTIAVFIYAKERLRSSANHHPRVQEVTINISSIGRPFTAGLITILCSTKEVHSAEIILVAVDTAHSPCALPLDEIERCDG